MVHRDDAARLFRLALESAPAGSVLHAVGDTGVPIRDIATHLHIPVVWVTPTRPPQYVGWLSRLWAFDGPASAELTHGILGWYATGPGLIDDLDSGHYSNPARA